MKLDKILVLRLLTIIAYLIAIILVLKGMNWFIFWYLIAAWIGNIIGGRTRKITGEEPDDDDDDLGYKEWPQEIKN